MAKKTANDLLSMTDAEIAAVPAEDWDPEIAEAAGMIIAMGQPDAAEDANPPMPSPERRAVYSRIERQRAPYDRAMQRRLDRALDVVEREVLAELDKRLK